ncbi:MAG: threonine synthase [Treponemataceae bacterium]|nr:MAG: threonine synthase [Treponemataceae bacterium]
MIYVDTRDATHTVNFRTACLEGMNAETGGLYVPLEYPRLPERIINRATQPSFRDMALSTAKLFIDDEIPAIDLDHIIADAYPFDAPTVPLDPVTYVLELFHGPTCAFKDFGARFMARAMAYFNKDEAKKLHILVATSGDTGSAVASAFHHVEGIDVTVLYPAGKISALQEKQLSTFDDNIFALKVDGTFDDCQKLVKTVFTDDALRKKLRFSSANSINISRLLPQTFYYIHSALTVRSRAQWDSHIENADIIMSVPSGNFGNLTSGLIAQKMGAPITGFIAATNANKTVPDWLVNGKYKSRASVQTLSNAMDVGAPSNYERMCSMYSLDEMRRLVAGYWLSDEGTLKAIKKCHTNTGYIIDPHGAIAWQAWHDMIDSRGGEKNTERLVFDKCPWVNHVRDRKAVGVVLETAHNSKFGETVKEACGKEVILPSRLERVLRLSDRSVALKNDYGAFKDWILSTR